MEIIFGLLSMIGFGMSNVLAKKLVQKEGHIKTAFITRIFSSLFLLIAIIFSVREFNFGIHYLWLVLIALVGYLPLFFFYNSLNKGRVGIVTPVSSSSIVFSVILAIVFLGESITYLQGLGITFVLLGIVLITYHGGKAEPESIYFSLLAGLFWGILAVLWKMPVMMIGALITAFFVELGVLVASYVHIRYNKLKIRNHFSGIGVGFFVALGIATFSLGIREYDVSIISTIRSSYPLLVSLYATFFLSERLHIKEWIGVVLTVIGIIFL